MKNNGVLVTPQDNQMILHYEKYNVNYIVEFNYVKDKLEVTYLFDPTMELSEDQKLEIVEATKIDILETI
jgi:hypothetical protein